MFLYHFLNLRAAQLHGMRAVDNYVFIMFLQESVKPGKGGFLGTVRHEGKALHIILGMRFFLNFIDLAADKAGKTGNIEDPLFVFWEAELFRNLFPALPVAVEERARSVQLNGACYREIFGNDVLPCEPVKGVFSPADMRDLL